MQNNNIITEDEIKQINEKYDNSITLTATSDKENDDRPRTNADYLRSLDDDKLADWLCNQFWEDYKSDDVINIIRYNQVRNFLKMEYKNDI